MAKNKPNAYVRVLRMAYLLIESHGSNYVCLAVDHVTTPYGRNSVERLAAQKIVDHIHEVLGHHADIGVGSWLHHAVGIEDNLLGWANMRLYRMRWIKHLISQYKHLPELELDHG